MSSKDQLFKSDNLSDAYDINQLFSTKTVAEIRTVKQKIVDDVEKKKADLRNMVGERYRDLIEAANTIASIKTGSEEVRKSIEKIESITCGISGERFLIVGDSKLRCDSVSDGK
ncbi:unnamed protein product [Notodromas monacha]|uniref:Conserved oligomeric Golgi complex subunit 1 n=1 Tax=Notodromas monacha TaxID=399045 RepID=A0A7R9BZ70_9CRUS|nr:unnamed protein product [Notodromas monacha]CAG0924512.1 unnamed protein product [Notodromas monacha]